MADKKYPAITEPTTNPESLRSSILNLKESVEIVTRQRGDKAMSAVTWNDLVELGLVSSAKVPK